MRWLETRGVYGFPNNTRHYFISNQSRGGWYIHLRYIDCSYDRLNCKGTKG